MSSNLLKTGFVEFSKENTRVIDMNELVAKRIEELSVRMKKPENAGFMEGLQVENVETASEEINSLLADPENEAVSNVIKASETPEDIKINASREAERILNEARDEANRIIMDAMKQAESEKAQIFETSRADGYAAGQKQAQAEMDKVKRELSDHTKKLEEEYCKLRDELEPQFVETITGIYEHIFHVELQSYREILIYLISSTMRRVEDSRNFLIHVSKEDYPYVSAQKKQLLAGKVSSNCVVEVVEDLTLSKNACLIETEGGIFDCGLGTQLSELGQRLRLLSYEK
ncbi:MAG: hypothetical protein II994_10085 [Lachnospiraceae bacterium]|nr:hypothetical protein [Lachnospiraceae bacterium]